MRTKTIYIILIFINLINLSCEKDSPYRWVNKHPKISIHSKPEFNSKVIGSIPYAAKIKFIKETKTEFKKKYYLSQNEYILFKGKWCYVDLKYGKGWIFGGYTLPDTEENRHKFNVYTFIKNPFTFEFNMNKDLHKQFLKKFGKPEIREEIMKNVPIRHSEIKVDKIFLDYNNLSILIYKNINFEFLKYIFIGFNMHLYKKKEIDRNYPLKLNISKKIKINNINNIFGRPNKIKKKKVNRTIYYYTYNVFPSKEKYYSGMQISFQNNTLTGIRILTNINKD